MVEAMKAKDKERKDSLSMLLSALKNAEIDKRSPLTPEQIEATIRQVLSDLGIEEPKASDKGKIMKVLMPLVKGKADGGEVNQILSGMFR